MNTTLTALGLGTMQPLAGLVQAPPVPSHIPSSLPARPLLRPAAVRPTEHPDPGVRQRVGALIGLFASSLVTLDHSVRQLQSLGVFKHHTKQQVNLLAAHADKLLTASQSCFDSQDADAANALSAVLGQMYELALQCTPDQLESSLHHLHNMAAHNVAYVPALVPYSPTSTYVSNAPSH